MFGLDIQSFVATNGLGDPETAKYHAAGLLCILTVCLLIFVPAFKPEVSHVDLPGVFIDFVLQSSAPKDF